MKLESSKISDFRTPSELKFTQFSLKLSATFYNFELLDASWKLKKRGNTDDRQLFKIFITFVLSTIIIIKIIERTNKELNEKIL